MRHLVLCCALFVAAWPAAGSTSEFPGASGIAPLGDRAFLCVQDVKDRPQNEGADRFGALIVFTDEEREKFSPRLGMLTYTTLTWCYGANVDCSEPFPSDLEALCAVPGRPGHYLACESAYWEGRYGRLFELHVVPGGNETWAVVIDRVLRLPQLGGEIEGLVAAATGTGRVRLILGERGGGAEAGPGVLHSGWLDELEAGQDGTGPASWPHKSLEVANPFDGEEYVTARAISDLYLADDGTLWATAAYDPDRDAGPFASCVRSIAALDPTSGELIGTSYDATSSWLLEGLKIEALGSCRILGGLLCFATDDEGYGGIWRPLGEPTNIYQAAAAAGSDDQENAARVE